MTAEQRTAFHVLSWGCPLVLLVPPLVPPGRRSKIKASKNQCKKRVRINLTQHFNTNGTRPQFEHRTPVHHGQMKTRHRRRFEIRTHHPTSARLPRCHATRPATSRARLRSSLPTRDAALPCPRHYCVMVRLSSPGHEHRFQHPWIAERNSAGVEQPFVRSANTPINWPNHSPERRANASSTKPWRSPK